MSRAQRLLRPVIGAALLLSLAACGPLGSTKPATPGPAGSPIVVGGSPLLNKPAPPIERANLSGENVSLADYAGRPAHHAARNLCRRALLRLASTPAAVEPCRSRCRRVVRAVRPSQAVDVRKLECGRRSINE